VAAWHGLNQASLLDMPMEVGILFAVWLSGFWFSVACSIFLLVSTSKKTKNRFQRECSTSIIAMIFIFEWLQHKLFIKGMSGLNCTVPHYFVHVDQCDQASILAIVHCRA